MIIDTTQPERMRSQQGCLIETVMVSGGYNITLSCPLSLDVQWSPGKRWPDTSQPPVTQRGAHETR